MSAEFDQLQEILADPERRAYTIESQAAALGPVELLQLVPLACHSEHHVAPQLLDEAARRNLDVPRELLPALVSAIPRAGRSAISLAGRALDGHEADAETSAAAMAWVDGQVAIGLAKRRALLEHALPLLGAAARDRVRAAADGEVLIVRLGILALLDPDRLAAADMVLDAGGDAVAALQSGTLPYQSDALFRPDEVDALAAALAVRLAADAPETDVRLRELLPGVAIAPTAANTAPSQSATYALGAAVAANPTPETIAVLKEVGREVRHQGVLKKLTKHTKLAEKALPGRGDLALRAPEGTLTPTQLKTFFRRLEGQLPLEPSWPAADWRRIFREHPQVSKATAALLWRHHRADGSIHTVLGDESIEHGLVSLWHPLLDDQAGRAAAIELVGIRAQPFKQIDRETFAPEWASAQAHRIVDVHRMLGVAHSEGWVIDRHYGLRRQFGGIPVLAQFSSYSLYPGAHGEDALLGVEIAGGPLATHPPLLVSEVLRAVSLLLAVGDHNGAHG